MMALCGAALAASLLGSLHCAGMCGPFVAFVSSPHPSLAPRGTNFFAPIAAYHLARLFVYAMLGSVFGALGAAVDFGGSLAGIQRAAAFLAGGVLTIGGLLALVRAAAPMRISPSRSWYQRFATFGFNRAGAMRPTPRAALTGFLTVLLPCGWLWAFLVAAAGAGGTVAGGLLMTAFWLGTLPVLVTLGWSTCWLTSLLGERLRMVTALALVGLGLMTIGGRIGALDGVQRATAAQRANSPRETIRSAAEEKPACCRGAHE